MAVSKSLVKRPLLAIRAKCVDCSCNQFKEVAECPVLKCPIWPYRMGKRPTEGDKERYNGANS